MSTTAPITHRFDKNGMAMNVQEANGHDSITTYQHKTRGFYAHVGPHGVSVEVAGEGYDGRITLASLTFFPDEISNIEAARRLARELLHAAKVAEENK